jgi:hypothetical protein
LNEAQEQQELFEEGEKKKKREQQKQNKEIKLLRKHYHRRHHQPNHLPVAVCWHIISTMRLLHIFLIFNLTQGNSTKERTKKKIGSVVQ